MTMRRVWLALGFAAMATAAGAAPPKVVDHHQHLFSPAVIEIAPDLPAVSAAQLVRMMDQAGVSRAVVLSLAYQFGNPNKDAIRDEYARVVAENDWTAREVRKFPRRLVGFCSFNPLKDYALSELQRCARNPDLRTGIKLHFGNSDVDLEDPVELALVQRVFRAANARGMAIVVHLHPSISMRRPYGAAQARIFLEQLLPAAPDVPIQVAHLGGAGGYGDAGFVAALDVLAAAIDSRDSRVAKLYFDVSAVAGVGDWLSHTSFIAARLRQLGLERLLFGSDGAAAADGTPAARLAAFRKLPLTPAEFRVIESNVAPYLH
jgi:uncharacterized protein